MRILLGNASFIVSMLLSYLAAGMKKGDQQDKRGKFYWEHIMAILKFANSPFGLTGDSNLISFASELLTQS